MHKVLYAIRAIAKRTFILIVFFIAFAWLLYLAHRLVY